MKKITTKTKKTIATFRNILQETDISDLIANGNLKESFIDSLYQNIDNIEIAYDDKVVETRLDLANAQFLGFQNGKWNRNDITLLVESMGLLRNEWSKLIKDYEINNLLDEKDIKEIDNYFYKKL